jgi:hypothetical protein
LYLFCSNWYCWAYILVLTVFLDYHEFKASWWFLNLNDRVFDFNTIKWVVRYVNFDRLEIKVDLFVLIFGLVDPLRLFLDLRLEIEHSMSLVTSFLRRPSSSYHRGLLFRNYFAASVQCP